MTIHKRGFARYIEKAHIYLAKYRCEFFIIYVVAYQPSSYTEL